MEKEWYVVNTYSGHENKVKEKLEMRASTMGLEDYIFRVVVPEQTEVEIKDGKTKYLFREVAHDILPEKWSNKKKLGFPVPIREWLKEEHDKQKKLIEEYGVKTEKNNAAEGWMLSCHEAGSSTVANGNFAGMSFADVVKENPELCGNNAKNFADFPILIKFIFNFSAFLLVFGLQYCKEFCTA